MLSLGFKSVRKPINPYSRKCSFWFKRVSYPWIAAIFDALALMEIIYVNTRKWYPLLIGMCLIHEIPS